MAVYRATDGFITFSCPKVWWTRIGRHGLTKVHLRWTPSAWKTMCGIIIPAGARDGSRSISGDEICGRCRAVRDARPGVRIEVVKPRMTGGYVVWLYVGKHRASLLSDSKGTSWWARRCDATKVANWWASWITTQQHTSVPIIYKEGYADDGNS